MKPQHNFGNVCECVCKWLLFFTVGLRSLECECPTENRSQTNRSLTEEEGSFVRHKHWNDSIQPECVCACVREKEVMCVSLRDRVYVYVEEIESV